MTACTSHCLTAITAKHLYKYRKSNIIYFFFMYTLQLPLKRKCYKKNWTHITFRRGRIHLQDDVLQDLPRGQSSKRVEVKYIPIFSQWHQQLRATGDVLAALCLISCLVALSDSVGVTLTAQVKPESND